MSGPDWSLEQAAMDRGHRLVAGVDEVGRGPLAGPVITAAVIFPPGLDLAGIRDSKRLSERQRLKAEEKILSSALSVGFGAAGPGEIDRLNILQATLLAMRRAVAELEPGPDYILVDGNRPIGGGLAIAQETVVKGDDRSFSIAAASILAKLRRDRIMVTLDRVFPGYGLARHKGYGTKAHYRALAEMGPSFAHRRCFRLFPQPQGELFE